MYPVSLLSLVWFLMFRCVIVPLCPCALVSLCPCVIVPLCPCALVSLCPCVIVPLCHCALVSLCPCVVVPLCHCAFVSLCLCVGALWLLSRLTEISGPMLRQFGNGKLAFRRCCFVVVAVLVVVDADRA